MARGVLYLRRKIFALVANDTKTGHRS